MMKKVLIIEDDQWFAETISTSIKKGGFTTRVSPHVVAAMEDIDKFIPDFIVMDLLLAGSTAFNLMNELQSHSDLAKIPIIVCSNLAEHLDLNDLRPYGVYDILNKSTMHPEDILSAINRVKINGKK